MKVWFRHYVGLNILDVINIVHSTLLGSQITIWSIFWGVRLLLKYVANFGEMYFTSKRKTLNLAVRFKLNTYTVPSFPQKCVKDCPTVTTENNIWISLWWDNQIRKRFLIWITLSRCKCLRKYHFPKSWECQCFQIWKRYTITQNWEIALMAKTEIDTIEYMNYFKGV